MNHYDCSPILQPVGDKMAKRPDIRTYPSRSDIIPRTPFPSLLAQVAQAPGKQNGYKSPVEFFQLGLTFTVSFHEQK